MDGVLFHFSLGLGTELSFLFIKLIMHFLSNFYLFTVTLQFFYYYLLSRNNFFKFSNRDSVKSKCIISKLFILELHLIESFTRPLFTPLVEVFLYIYMYVPNEQEAKL